MKKLLLLALMVPALLASCSDYSEEKINPPVDGKGHLVLLTAVTDYTVGKEKISTRATPTTDFSTYYVKLEGPENMTVPYPSTNAIENLTPGNYTVTVMSHPDMPDPEFDVQYYVGSTTAEVEAGESVSKAIVCTQANAGVYFVYDDSVSELDLIPTVTQGSDALIYSGANKLARGYFAPGDAVVTIKNGTEDWYLDGETSQTLTLGARELWKVTLSAVPAEDGSIILSVTVEVTDTATDNITFVVGGDGTDPGTLLVDELVGEWTALGYIVSGTQPYYLDHAMTITKIDDTSVKVDAILAAFTGNVHDAVIMTVDNENRTVSIAHQEFYGGDASWDEDGWPVYFNSYDGPASTDVGGLLNIWGNGFEDIAVAGETGSYEINLISTYSIGTINGVTSYGSIIPLTTDPSNPGVTIYGYGLYTCDTIWKQGNHLTRASSSFGKIPAGVSRTLYAPSFMK